MGSSCRIRCTQCVSSLFIAMCFLAQVTELVVARPFALSDRSAGFSSRGLKFLVEESTILEYHNGTILTGSGPAALNVYLIWYGNFTDFQRSIVHDFFASTQSTTCTPPSVADWWKMTGSYKDLSGVGVPPELIVGAETSDAGCSKGKDLLQTDLEALVTSSLAEFPADPEAMYIVLTAEDVMAADFCNSECGSHYSTDGGADSKNEQLAYGWVGNPGTQCPGKCSWPFAQPTSGPTNTPLLPPNGDVGMDGLIINLSTILAGMATNPYDTGYFQGDATAPNEAASACVGMFGPGSYPGYAGQLLSDSSTGASFNTWGVNGRKYLLPALWNPVTMNCTTPN
ncbi:unnamed protein product [Calypogeia fissa]